MAQYTIGELCEVIKGNTSIQKATPGEYPLVVTAENRLSCSEYQFDCKAVCVPLVSSTGHGHASIKRIHYQNGKFALGSILAAIIPRDESFLMPEYLYTYLSFMKDKVLVPLMKGSANVSLTVNSLCSALIEVPSVEKQREIIDVAQKVKENGNKLLSLWNMQTEDIKSLRRSIFQESILGKLVSQDNSEESVDLLLTKIEEANQKSTWRIGKREKPRQLITIDEMQYKIPNNWRWVRLGDVVNIKSSRRIFESDYCTNGIPFYRSKEIGELSKGIDKTPQYFISKEYYEKLMIENGVPQKDDIMLTCLGGSIGNAWISDGREFYYKDGNVVILEKSDYVVPDYIYNYIYSKMFTDMTQNDVSGTAYNALTIVKIKSLPFPLPPLEEQIRIVKKVKQLLIICDQLEANITKQREDSEDLLQSVLLGAISTESGKLKMENLAISLGKFIKLTRESKDITVTNMIKMLGNMKLSEYSRIEAGITEPDIAIKEKIARILDLDSSERNMFFKLPANAILKNLNHSYSDNTAKIAARRSQE